MTANEPAEVVEAFYRALRSRDVPRLLSVIAPDVEVSLAERLPAGWGGLHQGRDSLLQTWAAMASEIVDLSPYPTDVVPHGDDMVIVVGAYIGRSRDDRPFSADFAHVVQVRDGHILRLRQITDTAAWHTAVGPLPERGSAAPESEAGSWASVE